MAGIQSLPDELLVHLFSKLDRKSSLPDLLALRLVDKRCARLATDLVYLTIPGSDKSLPSAEAHDKHPNIRRWAHKIFQNPECGPMVKELVCGRSNPMPVGTTFPEDGYEMSDELYDALRKIEPKLETWVARLSNRDSHIFLLLTLALSPNLERFHTMRGLSGLGLVALLFEQIAKNRGPPCGFLTNVESIKIVFTADCTIE
ncbi:Putative F-box-like domain superfamily protein [Septoria linicola]|uniref:F-box-like domain superfamily protein n=1 Tax=Septoria linicola TaxID=215465 RepID=A0A9Q9EIR3_9PEZI|nr:putative F-box-like domain superfamily protein [Septoria linicola]USW51317.1 Putative F-box-like domain superfamily protein [Septoria linicola]